jgi:pre-mRNA-splicing factor CWC26
MTSVCSFRYQCILCILVANALHEVSGQSAEFRKSKKSNWTSVGSAAPTNAEQAAADAILASAAAENAQHQNPDEETPEIVDEDGVLRMESGANAGLQTAEQVTAAMKRKHKEEKRKLEEAMAEMGGKAQETIYRDASGRIINVAMKRAEARKKQEEEERKKAEELEAAKGDVQRLQKEQKRQQVADAKYMTVARRADDVKLNEELKERDRWNDPAAQFLAKKKSGKSATGRPLYQGSAPPNRYHIRPGHRWDGVDRSNGFEKDYFAARNKKSNIRDLEYAWQMDE